MLAIVFKFLALMGLAMAVEVLPVRPRVKSSSGPQEGRNARIFLEER